MTPAAGWYPDPSGTAQLRFWDGQNWTSSTAEAAQPAPAASYAAAPIAPSAYAPEPTYAPQPTYGQQPPYVAQPTYTATPQSWGAGPVGLPPQQPRSRKRIYALVAGVAVIAAVVATVVPLTSGSSHGVPTVAKLTDKLLTSDKVGEIAAGNFTSSPASDDGSDDNSKADCKDVVNAPAGVEKAAAARDFDDGSGQFAEEDLSYTVGAASLFSQLKTQLAACHTLTLDGGQLALSTLPDPLVGGSDDTLAMQASGTISGIDFVFDIVAARFGNGVIEVTYGSTEDAAQVSSICNKLLQASAAKAKSAF